jgi:hypothetical protein
VVEIPSEVVVEPFEVVVVVEPFGVVVGSFEVVVVKPS